MNALAMKAANDPVILDTYLRLFQPYSEQLRTFQSRDGEYGARFALLFRQTIRLLVLPADINQRLPALYTTIAERYLANEPATVRHFSYEDNRYFFLIELLDWLKVHERGERMRS